MQDESLSLNDLVRGLPELRRPAPLSARRERRATARTDFALERARREALQSHRFEEAAWAALGLSAFAVLGLSLF